MRPSPTLAPSELGAVLVLWVVLVPLLPLLGSSNWRDCGAQALQLASRVGCEVDPAASARGKSESCASDHGSQTRKPRCCVCLRICDLTMLTAPQWNLDPPQACVGLARAAAAQTLDFLGQPPSPPPKLGSLA